MEYFSFSEYIASYLYQIMIFIPILEKPLKCPNSEWVLELDEIVLSFIHIFALNQV